MLLPLSGGIGRKGEAAAVRSSPFFLPNFGGYKERERGTPFQRSNMFNYALLILFIIAYCFAVRLY